MSTPASSRPFVLGAVAYDPKVVTIWEGFTDWFAAQGFAFDYVLYSNYEAQAEAHLAGARRRHVGLAAGVGAHPPAGRGRRSPGPGGGDARHRPGPHVGRARARRQRHHRRGRPGRAPRWPPARSTRRRRRCSRWPTSPSPASIRAPTFTVRRFDVMVGKHGDHVGGEREAVKALLAGDGRRRLRDRRQPAGVRQGGPVRRRRAPGADADRRLRPLHDDGARRRRSGRGRSVRRAAAVDVVRRSRRPSAARARGSAGVAARSHVGLRPARGGRRPPRLLRPRRLDPAGGLLR